MHLRVLGLFAAMFLCACSSSFTHLQQSAQARLQGLIASQFQQRLSKGIGVVVSELAAEGGYLDDPLVRILMPPPLGLAINVARDFHQDPQSTLLTSLMNHAAEQAIPIAGPILQDALMNMDTLSTEALFNAGQAATTGYLKDKVGSAVENALMPAVTETLVNNGAVALYGEMVAAQEKTKDAIKAVQDSRSVAKTAATALTQDELSAYVAAKATEGLFKKISAKELALRNSLNDLGGEI